MQLNFLEKLCSEFHFFLVIFFYILEYFHHYSFKRHEGGGANPDWKNIHKTVQEYTFLSIMRGQYRAPLKPINNIVL